MLLPCLGDINNEATSSVPESANIAKSSDGLIVIAAASSAEMSMLSPFKKEEEEEEVVVVVVVVTGAPFVMTNGAPPVVVVVAVVVGLNGADGGCGEPMLGPPPPDRSRKASEGEKPSGLPCCDVDSFEADDRAFVFLRIGRIHGGRDLADGPVLSGRGDSSGI